MAQLNIHHQPSKPIKRSMRRTLGRNVPTHFGHQITLLARSMLKFRQMLSEPRTLLLQNLYFVNSQALLCFYSCPCVHGDHQTFRFPYQTLPANHWHCTARFLPFKSPAIIVIVIKLSSAQGNSKALLQPYSPVSLSFESYQMLWPKILQLEAAPQAQPAAHDDHDDRIGKSQVSKSVLSSELGPHQLLSAQAESDSFSPPHTV
jgi:hypothetical protein